MNSQGPSPSNYSKCVFDLALEQTPKPTRVALIGADVEYSRNALDGARENAKTLGFEIVFERTYPLVDDGIHLRRAGNAGGQSGRRVCARRCRSTRPASFAQPTKSSSSRR